MNEEGMMAAHLAASTPLRLNKTAYTNKRQRMGSNSCPKCDIMLDDQTDCMPCCVCELNYCIKCTSISEILLAALKEDTTQNFKWTCNGCKQNFPCMTGLTQKLKTIETNTQDKFLKIEERLTCIDQEIGLRVKKEVNSIKSSLVDDVRLQIQSTLQDDVRTEMYEIEEQKRRALNLIIFNLPESTSINSQERKNHDNEHFIDLCKQIGVHELDIAASFRLGNPSTGKIRPLKIVLNNKKHRKNILDNVSNIKMLTNPTIEKCIIVKDLTVRQREINKKRRDEKKRDSTKKGKGENQAYHEQTICLQEDLKNQATGVATIENVNIGNTNNDLLSFSQYRSQPLLAQTRLHHYEALVNNSMDMITADLSLSQNVGDDTVIGGINTNHDSPGNAGTEDLSKK